MQTEISLSWAAGAVMWNVAVCPTFITPRPSPRAAALFRSVTRNWKGDPTNRTEHNTVDLPFLFAFSGFDITGWVITRPLAHSSSSHQSSSADWRRRAGQGGHGSVQYSSTFGPTTLVLTRRGCVRRIVQSAVSLWRRLCSLMDMLLDDDDDDDDDGWVTGRASGL